MRWQRSSIDRFLLIAILHPSRSAALKRGASSSQDWGIGKPHTCIVLSCSSPLVARIRTRCASGRQKLVKPSGKFISAHAANFDLWVCHDAMAMFSKRLASSRLGALKQARIVRATPSRSSKRGTYFCAFCCRWNCNAATAPRGTLPSSPHAVQHDRRSRYSSLQTGHVGSGSQGSPASALPPRRAPHSPRARGGDPLR